MQTTIDYVHNIGFFHFLGIHPQLGEIITSRWGDFVSWSYGPLLVNLINLGGHLLSKVALHRSLIVPEGYSRC